MKKKKLAIISVFVFLNTFVFFESNSQIMNKIVVKVGDSIVTTNDVQNEILTNLIIRKQAVTQENINNNKDFAIKSLLNVSIKKSEINKFEITDYSKKDLNQYVLSVAKLFDTNIEGLKKIFKINNINYNIFIEKRKIELTWNTLIYRIYSNQININIIDVENEIEKMKDPGINEYNLSEIKILNSEFNEDKLEEVLKTIKEEGFDRAAEKFSIAPSSKKGGDIGWISKKSLSKKYLKQVQRLKLEEISPPIMNDNSVSILKINKVRTSKNKINTNDIKKKIIIQKQEEKLNLFSRSHFSNLENTIIIDFL